MHNTDIHLCWLCGKKTVQQDVFLRSKKTAKINYCSSCEFRFFSHSNQQLIQSDQLDVTRLESAGLTRPEQKKDFENGYEQSKNYIIEYITRDDIGQNILEIGCSWGYFLQNLKEAGSIPYGVELNSLRASFVENTLKIPCKTSLDYYINNRFKFKKIFLFYCLEYIESPQNYLSNLIDLLEENGEIILITPNLEDVLKDIWRNKGYIDFFYDECAVGYYSKKSTEILCKKLSEAYPSLKIHLSTKQGYSVFNHLFWLFNEKPYPKNRYVGEDTIAKDSFEVLLKSPCGEKLHNMLASFDNQYKKVIESCGFGNQILLKLKRAT
jgi:SAM-dependent methyltransferase